MEKNNFKDAKPLETKYAKYTKYIPFKGEYIEMVPVITYIVAKLPYSIFQTQYICQPNLLHYEMLR